MEEIEIPAGEVLIDATAAQRMMSSLPPEQHIYLRLLARAIKQPDEIWVRRVEGQPLTRIYFAQYEFEETGERVACFVICYYDEAKQVWIVGGADVLEQSQVADYTGRVNMYRTGYLLRHL